MKFAANPLSTSRKSGRGTRGIATKRAQNANAGSASQARARLQTAFSEGPVATQVASSLASSTPVQIHSDSAVSVAALLKTQSVAPEAESNLAAIKARHVQSAAAPLAEREFPAFNAEQTRRLCIDHAILISKLKRIDTAALATMLGMPTDNVRKALSGMEEALRAPEWDRVIEIMGIDPQTARLNRSMPHFIHVTPASLQAFQALESIFLNMRAARMQFDDGLIKRLRNNAPRVVVMQNDHLRVVLIEHEGVRALESVNGIEWARGSEKASQVKAVFSRDRFVAGDLTAIEFDTLFAGDRRIDWDYVELVARANRVSMEDIVGYIQSVGEQKSHDAQTYLKVVNGN